MLTRNQEAKEEAAIKKLIEKLGLTDAQAAKLRAKLASNRERLAALAETEGGGIRGIRDFTRTLNNDHLDEALADILTDDQRTAYDEMKQRERQNKVEASAYKELAKVQGVLDLSGEQKDQVYQLLHDQADQSMDTNKDANAIVASVTEGFGVDLGSGFATAIQGFINQSDNGEEPTQDRAQILQAMQESRQKEIDSKVELLAPVLDDQQEVSYREHLETSGGGILGGILQGEELNVETLDIQISPTPTPLPTPKSE